MVRLIPLSRLNISQEDLFQFHYGTIDTIEIVDEGKLLRGFNSTMVRLILTAQFHTFQTQNVSIPLWYDWYLRHQTYKPFQTHSFQFHYGTIDTFTQSFCIFTFHRFNSTMVRLIRSPLSLSPCMSFVSIPLWYDWYSPTICRMIQGQTVSIPLWYDWYSRMVKILRSVLGFNSTMVRLILLTREHTNWINTFQFHYGTIDTFKNFSRSGLGDPSFNSTMVRLILLGIQHNQSPVRFQFHYGTIDTTLLPVSLRGLGYVSIPLWYDWYSCYPSPFPRPKYVSIPLWYDWYHLLSYLSYL